MRSFAYTFWLNMWIMKHADAEKLQKAVEGRWITEREKEAIMMTPQVK